jgi:hypothetical protein
MVDVLLAVDEGPDGVTVSVIESRFARADAQADVP